MCDIVAAYRICIHINCCSITGSVREENVRSGRDATTAATEKYDGFHGIGQKRIALLHINFKYYTGNFVERKRRYSGSSLLREFLRVSPEIMITSFEIHSART